MASVSISTVTATVTAKAAAATTAASRAAAQGGILEGANPSHYNPKDPIITFIIQVYSARPKNGMTSLTVNIGRLDHYFHPPPPLSPLSHSPTSCHCRNYRRYLAWAFGSWSHTGLLRCHLPQSLDAHTHAGCQSWPGSLPVLGRSRSRPANHAVQLEGCP